MKVFRTIFRPAVLPATVLLLGSVVLAWAYEGHSNYAKGVNVEVTPITLSLNQPAVFSVRLNTHTVQLTQDLAAVSELRDDQGRTYKPVSWQGAAPGGHHRSGTLTFPALKGPAGSLTLIIHDIAGVERTFEWQLK